MNIIALTSALLTNGYLQGFGHGGIEAYSVVEGK